MSVDAPSDLEGDFFIVGFGSGMGRRHDAGVVLAPLRTLLKIELHWLVRCFRRRGSALDFTWAWQLTQMEFDASVQGPSVGRLIRSYGIFSSTPDSD